MAKNRMRLQEMKIKVGINWMVGAVFMGLMACTANQENNDLTENWDQAGWEEILEDEADDYEEEEEYVVDIITDTDQLEDLQIELDNVMDVNRLNSDLDMNMGTRYVWGETELADEIIDLLNGNHSTIKTELFSDLDVTAPQHYKLNDLRLVKAITNNLYQWRDEASAIQLMANQKLPNYLTLFEKRLVSGESNQEGELIYQLLAANKSAIALKEAEKRIKSETLGQEDLARTLDGFKELCEIGNAQEQKKIDELCWHIYKKRLIPEDDFTELEDDYAFGNPAKTLLELLFDYGDSTALPLAYRFEHNQAVSTKALGCLVRLEGEKHRRKIIDLMKDASTYTESLPLVPIYYANVGDMRMIKSAIINFELLYAEEDYTDWILTKLVKTLLQTLGEVGARKAIFDYMENEYFRSAAFALIRIELKTIDDIAAYFFDKGLVSEPIDQQLLERASLTAWTSNLDAVLSSSNCYLWTDSENWFPEYDFDVFRDICKEIAPDWLGNMQFTVDPATATEETSYLAILGDKGYRMDVAMRDESDYRYVDDIIFFINFVLADQKCDKRFVEIRYDEYFFGEEKAIEQLKEDFRLDY